MQHFVDTLSNDEKKTFVEKVKDFLRNIKQWFESYLSKHPSKAPEAQAVRDVPSRIDGQIKLWDEMLKSSIAANQALKKEGIKAQKNTTDGDVQFAIREDAKAEVKTALTNKHYNQEIKLTDNSPSILLSQKGVKNLPMMMKASHIRENILTEEEAKKKGFKVNKNINYHGLGESLFYKVIDGLDEVKEAYRGTKNAENSARRENYFLLISQYTDKDGNIINVPVYINEKGLYNRVFIDTNKIATVFGKNEFRKYIREQINKGNLVRIKNRSTQASESTSPINADYGKNASKDIIRQNDQKSQYQNSDRENSVEFASNEEYNNWESYELTAEFTKNVPYSERHTFLRSLANKTNGMRRGEHKNIVIITDKHVYFYEATGYMNGSIAKRSGLTKKANAEIKVWSDYYGSIDTSTTTFDSWFEDYGSGTRRNDRNNDVDENGKTTGQVDNVDATTSESNPIGDTWESNGDFETEELIPGSIVYNDNDVAFKVADDGSIETLQFADRYTDSIDNTNIEKYGYNADNISRANKQGELINDYYNALSKSEWRTFYKEISEQHYLAIARVGTVAPIVVGDKLVIAKRLYIGKDAHDYVVLDAYQVREAFDGGDSLDLLVKKTRLGELIYDRQTMYRNISRILKSNQSAGILSRFDANSQRYVSSDTTRFSGESNEAIYQDSQERLDREGLSLRDKSSLQENDELLSFADRDEVNIYNFMGENQRLIKENEKNGLTEPEVFALLNYKSSYSYKINAMLRNFETLNDSEKEFVKNLDYALSKLPIYSGIVYRNISFDTLGGQKQYDAFINEHKIGDIVSYTAFTSASTKNDGYLVDGNLVVSIVIESVNARDVDGYGNNFENEVIFARNSDYVVKSIEYNHKGQPIIYLTEVTENVNRKYEQFYTEKRREIVQSMSEPQSRYDNLQGISTTNTTQDFNRGDHLQKVPTKDRDLKLSDRDEVNIYDLMGENQRLIKENEKIKADIERLKERLEIERQVTHGNYFNENQLNAVAGHLRNIANTTYSKTELVHQLKDSLPITLFSFAIKMILRQWLL